VEATAASPRTVGWIRLSLPHDSGNAEVRELDTYPVTDGGMIRHELALIALQSRWRPLVAPSARLLLLLGADATAQLSGDAGELEAYAAVDGLHLTVLSVPQDSSTRAWVETRDRALQAEGTIVIAVTAEERSAQQILRSLHDKGRATVDLALDGTAGGDTPIDVKALASLLAPQSAGEPKPASPAPTARQPVQRAVTKEIYLAKTDSAPGFDIMRETGHRCHHNSFSRLSPRRAPKKYKGVQRFLAKNDPRGVLLRAERCTASACGLVRIEYETIASATPVPAEDLGDLSSAWTWRRGPPPAHGGGAACGRQRVSGSTPRVRRSTADASASSGADHRSCAHRSPHDLLVPSSVRRGTSAASHRSTSATSTTSSAVTERNE
jgi:hypothetical protein